MNVTLTLNDLIEHYTQLLASRDARIKELDTMLAEINHSYVAIVHEFNELSAKHKALLEQPRCE